MAKATEVQIEKAISRCYSSCGPYSGIKMTELFEFVKTGTPAECTCRNQGADRTARDENGGTVLMLAAWHNQNPELVTLLLKAGADIKTQDWTYPEFVDTELSSILEG